MIGAVSRALTACFVGAGLLLAASAPAAAPPAPTAAVAPAAAPAYRVLPEERSRRSRPRRARPAAAPAPTRLRPAQRSAPRAAAPPAAARPAPAPARAAAPVAGALAPPLAVPVAGRRLQPGAPLPPAELEAFVDGMFEHAMAAEHVAGAVISVVQGGRVVLSKGYGFADYEPAVRRVDPDRTLFRIGSISKTFTWIALMQEVEAGRMRLDAPVDAYLPDALDLPRNGFDRPVRVRDLMTHSAGFEDRALGHLFERDPDQIRPLARYLDRERPRRVREAGVLPSYSNYGAALAGAAVAEAAGLPFADLVERRVTGPLGMTRTTFREPYPAREDLPAPMSAALAAQASAGFRWTGGRFQERPVEYIQQIAPAGAASSTGSDMARYMLAILGGGSLEGAAIYGPRTAAAFRTVLQRSTPGVGGWAHGFMEYPLPGGYRGFGHNGGTLSFFSNMVTVPELGLGVFVSTNTAAGGALAERAPGLIVQRFYAPPQVAPRPGSAALAADADAYAGAYLTTRRAYGGLEKAVAMFHGVAEVEVSPDGRLMVSRGGEVDSWSPEGRPGAFRATDGEARLVFALERGRATRFYSPSGGAAYDRLSWMQAPGLVGLFAVLTLVVCVVILGGSVLRFARGSRQSPAQRRSGIVETTTAFLWLLAFGALAVWAAQGADEATVVYGWPGPALLTASWSALLAALLSLGLLVLLFPSLRGDWRGGWSLWRRLGHTATVLILCVFSGLLLSWGALAAWSA